MTEMTVSEMIALKAHVEQAIKDFVLEQIGTFSRESGLLVIGVDIKLSSFTAPISKASQTLCEGVHMKVYIPPPERDHD